MVICFLLGSSFRITCSASVKNFNWFPCFQTWISGNPFNCWSSNMAKPRKSPIKPRARAFSLQDGRCYYCGQPMWTKKNRSKFLSRFNVTLPQVMRFQCTAEHLTAHQDGGTIAQGNIVAACWFCNQQRHRRKIALVPEQFKKLVQQRMSKGRWHGFRLTS